MRDYYNKIIEFCYLKNRELESIKERLVLYKKSPVIIETATKIREEINSSTNIDHKKVFVVFGRNIQLRNSLFEYLRAIGLKPIEWNQAITATNKGTPSIGEILDVAFSQAQAIVVLLTRDDEARLEKQFLTKSDEDYEKYLTPQARPNVLFEAGMAMGRQPDRTILIQVGQLRPWSDIGGRHITYLDNNPQKRHELATKLMNAGCEVDLTGTDWFTCGNFIDVKNNDSRELTIGERVRHPVFGNGVVKKFQPEHDEVVVDFDNDGLKRLLFSLAKLETIT